MHPPHFEAMTSNSFLFCFIARSRCEPVKLQDVRFKSIVVAHILDHDKEKQCENAKTADVLFSAESPVPTEGCDEKIENKLFAKCIFQETCKLSIQLVC